MPRLRSLIKRKLNLAYVCTYVHGVWEKIQIMYDELIGREMWIAGQRIRNRTKRSLII